MDLQTYQNDHIDKVEIISLPKKCNKTGAKTDEKAGAKASAKVPWSTCHFFQSQKKLSKYCIKKLDLCRRLKGLGKLPEYSKYPEKMIVYNNRTKQMRQKREKVKPNESGDDQRDLLVDNMLKHEEKMKGKDCGEKNTDTAKKALKST